MQPILQIDRLVGGYANVDVLHDISFHVNRGEIVGLIGLNGAGKSTTLKHIIGLMKEKSGTITVHGNTLAQNITAYRKQIAFIPEQPILYDELTLYEHLQLTAMAYNIDHETFVARKNELLRAFRMERYEH